MKSNDGRSIAEFAPAGTPEFTACTPSDATTLSGVRGIYCAVAGTLSVKNHADTTVSIVAVAGQVIPISPAKVLAATTGTYILLY